MVSSSSSIETRREGCGGVTTFSHRYKEKKGIVRVIHHGHSTRTTTLHRTASGMKIR